MFPTQASVAIVTGNISNFISFYIRPLGTVTRENHSVKDFVGLGKLGELGD